MAIIAHSSIIILTQDGATPLYIASHNGHYDVVNILIKRGADIHLPFKVCSYYNYSSIVCYIYKNSYFTRFT